MKEPRCCKRSRSAGDGNIVEDLPMDAGTSRSLRHRYHLFTIAVSIQSQEVRPTGQPASVPADCE